MTGDWLPTMPGTYVEFGAQVPLRRGWRQRLRHIRHVIRRRGAWCAYCPRPSLPEYVK